MFVSDLRDIDRLAFPDIQLILQLLSHFSPHLINPRANAKDPPFGESVFPEKLNAYAADPALMGAFLKPNQLMASYIIKELARGKTQAPSYAPYIVAGVPASPWPVPTAEHTAAAVKWKANRQAAKAVNPQAALLTRGFFIVSDLSPQLIFLVRGRISAALPPS